MCVCFDPHTTSRCCPTGCSPASCLCCGNLCNHFPPTTSQEGETSVFMGVPTMYSMLLSAYDKMTPNEQVWLSHVLGAGIEPCHNNLMLPLCRPAQHHPSVQHHSEGLPPCLCSERWPGAGPPAAARADAHAHLCVLLMLRHTDMARSPVGIATPRHTGAQPCGGCAAAPHCEWVVRVPRAHHATLGGAERADAVGKVCQPCSWS